jgi:hypothetical protein
LTQVVDIKIDAQPDLDFLRDYEALQSLTVVYASETLKKGEFDTLPSLPHLQQLRVCLRESFVLHDADTGVSHKKLIDLSILQDLKMLELRSTGKLPIWSEYITGSSNSIEQMVLEDITLVGEGWYTFLARISDGLRSLTIANIQGRLLGPCRLRALETLEIRDSGLPNFVHNLDCPRLSMLVCIITEVRFDVNRMFENLISKFTASLQTFMLSSIFPSMKMRALTLSPSVMRSISHCSQLRNFLLDGNFTIPTEDWLILRKVHDELDRAIFILPHTPGDVESSPSSLFRVRVPLNIDHGKY